MPFIDMVLGLVPIAGDIGDVFWKADLRNMALLERHARPGVAPTRGDYWFVLGSIAAVIVIALVPFVSSSGCCRAFRSSESCASSAERWAGASVGSGLRVLFK